MNSTQRIETDCGGGTKCECNGGQESSDPKNQETETKTMTENDNPFADVANLTVDAVREQSTAVDERIEKLESKTHELQDAQDTLSDIRAYLECDDEDSILGTVKTLSDERESLQATVDEHEESEMDALRETIVDSSTKELDDIEDWDMDQLTAFVDAIESLDIETDTNTDSEEEGTVKTPTNDSDSESIETDVSGVFDPRELAVSD